jgi:hypothetical protein
MLKTLAAKAVVPVALTVTGFVVVCCSLLYGYIRTDMVSAAVRQEIGLADTIVKSTRYAMLKADRETLRQTINDIGDQQGVEHVRVFNKKGLVMFSAEPEEIGTLVDKETEGCSECHAGETPALRLGPMEQARNFQNARGEEVLAITAPIYNEAGCSEASCHFHPEGNRVLGTLDIGLSQHELRGNLLNLRSRMMIFCAMVLVLTVGGVLALLLRNVFLPLYRLRGYVRAAADGGEEHLPFGGAEEVEEIGGHVRDLSASLFRAREELTAARQRIAALEKRLED